MNIKAIAAVVMAGLIAIGVGACGGGSSDPTGFHVMKALEKSVSQQENQNLLADWGSGNDAGIAGVPGDTYPATVTSVTCIAAGANAATCEVVDDGTPDQYVLHVTIASDGKSYIGG